MSVRRDIVMSRNEDFGETWFLRDTAQVPINISEWEIKIQIKDKVSNLIVSEADVNIEPIAVGVFSYVIDGGPSSPLFTYGNLLHTAYLKYDIIAIDETGFRERLGYGDIVLERGITA
jgi:hypothetical protein